MAGFRVMSLSDMEAVPWKESMTWHPVRAQLGIRAFGAAAFSARAAGDWVVEPHTELEGRGHEELYLVTAGHARFRVDGEEIDAPTGTFVFVGDPALHREAVALEPDTTVLALGGDPVFQPAGDEYIARVRARLADPASAWELADEGLRELPDSAGARYAAALAAAASGDDDIARRLLADAVAVAPELAAEARRDAVFDGIRPAD